VECGTLLNLTQRTCPHCGVAIDSDGDGLPDALDALVERKARAIVAEEREREAADIARREAAEAARNAAEEQRQAEAHRRAAIEELRVRLADARAEIACAQRPPPNWHKFGTLVAIFTLLGAAPVSFVLEVSEVAHARYGLVGWWIVLFNTALSIAVMLVPAWIVVAILRHRARRAYLRELRAREAHLLKALAEAEPQVTSGATPYR
jgi:hypothetical protein